MIEWALRAWRIETDESKGPSTEVVVPHRVLKNTDAFGRIKKEKGAREIFQDYQPVV